MLAPLDQRERETRTDQAMDPALPSAERDDCDACLPGETDDVPQSSANPGSRVGNNALFVVGFRILGIAATMLGHLLAGRELGPALYGKFLFWTTLFSFGSLVAMRGLNEAGLRFVSECLANEKSGVARWLVLRVARTLSVNTLLTAGLFILVMLGFHVWVHRFDNMLWLLSITVLGIVALTWQQTIAELLRGYGDVRSASLYSGGQAGGPLTNALFLIMFAAAAWLWPPVSLVTALVFAAAAICLTVPFAFSGLLRTVTQWSTAIHVGKSGEGSLAGEPQPEREAELNRVGWVLMVNQLLAFGTYQLDIWLGEAMLEDVQLGYYGAAKRLVLLVQLPLQMAMMTVLPIVPRMMAQGKKRELETFLRSTATYAGIPAAIALVILLLAPRGILYIVFPDYLDAAPIILVMLIGHAVMIIVGNPPYILAMTGQQQAVVIANITAALSMVVFGAVGSYFWQGTGLAIGCSASLIAQHGILWYLARQRLGIWTHVGMPILPQQLRKT